MARNATLLELRTRAYQRGDFESRTDRFPTSEMNTYVNESIADLRDQLIRALGTDNYETSVSFSTAASTSIYPLDASFYQLLDVMLDPGSGYRKYSLDRFMRHERAFLSNSTISFRGYPTYYILTGTNIELLPLPQGVYTVTYRFIPVATKLSADGDTFDGINGWEEWVVCDVVRKMATKERDEKLIALMQSDLGRLANRIQALAGGRDRSGPRRVVDVRSSGMPRSGGWRR